MQPQVTYFKCTRHPKDVLTSVCKSPDCTKDRLVCVKCITDHKDCADAVVSIDEFLETLDTFNYSQNLSHAHQSYVNKVKEVQARNIFNDMRQEVLSAIDAAEKEVEQYTKLMLTIHEGSISAVCSRSKSKFVYG